MRLVGREREQRDERESAKRDHQIRSRPGSRSRQPNTAAAAKIASSVAISSR